MAEYLSACSSSDSEFHNENTEDLSYNHLETIPDYAISRANELVSLQLNNNEIQVLPLTICHFTRLVNLDISNNNAKTLCDELCQLRHLRTFVAKNNMLNSSALPKDFGLLQSLEVVNFSGNQFTDLAPQLTELPRLKCLYLGGNRLVELSSRVKNMQQLEVLYLGGNRLTEIPTEVGSLQRLVGLNLSDNCLQSLPASLVNLRRLQSLNLHNNCLQTLPPQIIALNLVELSLRKNPLVHRFVQDLVYNPPSLLELSGRVVKIEKIRYTRDDLPLNLIRYLDSAQRCVNPQCKGVYFTSRVEHVKFVDFCGKYRLPLLQYLCSPSCTTSSPSFSVTDSDSEEEDCARERMRRVLLG
ncbi:leucine-rich repeat-containing protein 58-like [Babylonia areolata]|uniref:leucine-rich repeat-containing protein 58-like n=1 Tax=Babylonia areolata TaxID=304850 RepID=UPI003FD1EA62